jgi:hypothetical protein
MIPSPMRCVILESPFADNTERNNRYALLCVADCIKRGDAPIASHLLYTRVLDDLIAHERELGIAAGHAWMTRAEACVVYYDLGISKGMEKSIEAALAAKLPVEYRVLPYDIDVRNI